jgi:hypothetical protein
MKRFFLSAFAAVMLLSLGMLFSCGDDDDDSSSEDKQDTDDDDEGLADGYRSVPPKARQI